MSIALQPPPHSLREGRTREKSREPFLHCRRKSHSHGFGRTREKMNRIRQDMLLLLSNALLGAAVLVSYVTVFGFLPLPKNAPANARSYLHSPYWLGMPHRAVTVLAFFQVLAMAGYLMWLFYVANHPPTRGLLSQKGWLLSANLLFLVPSAVWPFAAFRVVHHPHSVAWAMAACTCLWLAAIGVIMLVGGTFAAQFESSVLPIVGILLLALVVVLVDGVGWAAVAIFRALHDK